MWNHILSNPENGLWLGAITVFGAVWLVTTFVGLVQGKVF